MLLDKIQAAEALYQVSKQFNLRINLTKQKQDGLAGCNPSNLSGHSKHDRYLFSHITHFVGQQLVMSQGHIYFGDHRYRKKTK